MQPSMSTDNLQLAVLSRCESELIVLYLFDFSDKISLASAQIFIFFL
jgi:hypothetical protein